MPDTMIERAARALAKSDGGSETTWRMYVDDVRAVLTSMREPTTVVLSLAEGT